MLEVAEEDDLLRRLRRRCHEAGTGDACPGLVQSIQVGLGAVSPQ